MKFLGDPCTIIPEIEPNTSVNKDDFKLLQKGHSTEDFQSMAKADPYTPRFEK
jgi:hypothetical protein